MASARRVIIVMDNHHHVSWLVSSCSSDSTEPPVLSADIVDTKGYTSSFRFVPISPRRVSPGPPHMPFSTPASVVPVIPSPPPRFRGTVRSKLAGNRFILASSNAMSRILNRRAALLDVTSAMKAAPKRWILSSAMVRTNSSDYRGYGNDQVWSRSLANCSVGDVE